MGMWKVSFQRTSFLRLRETQEIIVASPTTTDSVDCENIHILNFKSHRKHLSIGDLNTQSMLSSFDEFYVMHQEHPFDVLTPWGTWLKDDVNLLKYVRIPGYKFSYKNRNERRGGGVGLYIKDSIEYKVLHDLNKTDKSIKHLWILKHLYQKLSRVVCYRATWTTFKPKLKEIKKNPPRRNFFYFRKWNFVVSYFSYISGRNFPSSKNKKSCS